MSITIPVLPSTSYYAYVEWLEKHDREVRAAADEIRRIVESGVGDEDAANERFNDLVTERLTGVVAICVACVDTANVVRGAELAMTNPRVGPIHTSCVKARMRAAVKGKCLCGSKKRRSDLYEPRGARGRAFISCLRCLGVIEQVR